MRALRAFFTQRDLQMPPLRFDRGEVHGLGAASLLGE
jgi:hypothetical protein